MIDGTKRRCNFARVVNSILGLRIAFTGCVAMIGFIRAASVSGANAGVILHNFGANEAFPGCLASKGVSSERSRVER